MYLVILLHIRSLELIHLEYLEILNPLINISPWPQSPTPGDHQSTLCLGELSFFKFHLIEVMQYTIYIPYIMNLIWTFYS